MFLELSPERKQRLAERLQEIKEKAVNYNGYYVLEEKEKNKINVFCSPTKYLILTNHLHHYHGRFLGGSTYYRIKPETKQYGYHLEINLTAKKTLQHLKTFLELQEGL